MRVALDTNIFVYALADVSDANRTRIARQLLEALRSSGDGVISTQVLKEFANVCTKKLKPDVSQAALLEYLDLLSGFNHVVVDADLTKRAVQRHYISQISFYDALIVEAALAGRAVVLYSEDFQHGMTFGPLSVVNPFL